MAASAALGTVLALPGCSADRDCAGVHGVDVGVASGQPTSRAALDALLRDPPKWLDPDGWTVGSTATAPDRSVTYVSGADFVTVTRSSQNGRWYLDSYQGCR